MLRGRRVGKDISGRGAGDRLLNNLLRGNLKNIHGDADKVVIIRAESRFNLRQGSDWLSIISDFHSPQFLEYPAPGVQWHRQIALK
jgi:hypothetical protein